LQSRFLRNRARAFDSFHGLLMERKCDRNGLHCLRSHRL
jgi:hypothetical protein